MDLKTVLECSLELAALAGTKILNHYGALYSVQTKADGSPLTLADQEANAVIVDGLAREFPEAAILSEESPDDLGRLDRDWCFLVDPLDGTKEFLSQNGEFTVNIALVHRGRPVVGVVLAPALNEVYYAANGTGAWYLGPDAVSQKLVCGVPQKPVRLVVSRSHRSPEEDQYIRDHQVGTVIPKGSSLKGCLVAMGAADLYLRAGTVMEWDIAAMQAIVEEAGGCVVQWASPTSPILYNQHADLRIPGFRCGLQSSISLR